MKPWIITLVVASAAGATLGFMIKHAWIAFPIILILWFGTAIYGVIRERGTESSSLNWNLLSWGDKLGTIFASIWSIALIIGIIAIIISAIIGFINQIFFT